MAVSNSTDRFNGVIASKAIKVPVKRATNVNRVLSGDPGVIDGWAWSNGDRILLYGQTNPIENGIWEVNVVGAWTRAPDFDGARDATESTLITAGRSGSLNPIMYILTTDTNPIRIGTDALAFQEYFDPDNPAAAGLQAVTDVGNTTTNPIVINGVTAYQPYLTLTNAGRILLENTTADGDITFGAAASNTFQLDANGITTRFQFTGFDEFRILGTGAPAGAVLVMGERNPISNPLPGPLAAFATIWVRDDTPNVLVFTDDTGTDWVLNTVDTLQSVTDNGNVTTNDIDLNGSNLILDDAGEVQFGTVAGGEINIRYNAVDNALEVYDASATNTSFRVGPGINNVIVNPEQNANAVVTIGESTTLRGDAQQAILNMYGEDTGVLRLGQVQNTGALWWFNAPTLPIQFLGTDFVMDTVQASVRGTVVGGLSEAQSFSLEDDNGTALGSLTHDVVGGLILQNHHQQGEMRFRGTQNGGSTQDWLEWSYLNYTRMSAPAGRDLILRCLNTTQFYADNLGSTGIYYSGTEMVRTTSASVGGFEIRQSLTGDGSSFYPVMSTEYLGHDAEFWRHDYNSFIMVDPTQSRFRLNNADFSLVTAIAVDDLTLSDRSFAGALATIQAGTQIRMVQTNNLTRWGAYEATGPAINNTTWWEIPVTYVAHSGPWSTTVREPFKFTFSNLGSAPIAAAVGSATSLTYAYDSVIGVPVDPGAGEFRASTVNPASWTYLLFSDTAADGLDAQNIISSMGAGSFIVMRNAADNSQYRTYVITGVTDNAGWYQVNVSQMAGNGDASVVAGTEITFEFYRTAFVDAGTDAGNANDLLYFDANRWRATGSTLRVNPNTPPLDGRIQMTGTSTTDRTAPNINMDFGVSGVGAIWRVEDGSSATDNFGAYADFSGAAYLAYEIDDHEYMRLNANGNVYFQDWQTQGGSSNRGFHWQEKGAAAAAIAGYGQIWVRNDTPNVLIFTDDAGTDWNLLNPGGTAQTITAGWSTGGGGSLTIAANAPLFYTEQAADDAPGAGQGQVWVRNDSPNVLMFTDDTGVDWQLTGTGGGIAGTVADNQIVVGTGASTVDSSAELTYNDVTGVLIHNTGLTTSVLQTGISGGVHTQINVEDNFTEIQFSDDSVDASVARMIFNIASASTGAHEYWWRDNDGTILTLDCTDQQLTMAGRLGLIAQTDHGANFASGEGQIWAKSRSLGDDLMFTADDYREDISLLSVMTHVYVFDNGTGAADPGAGQFRLNNSTPASVTQIYVNDADDGGRDAAYMLANLGVGDILTFRASNNTAQYFTARVNAAPTDNTGWWTIPVTPIHTGSLFSLDNPSHLEVQWLSRVSTLTTDLDVNGNDIVSNVTNGNIYLIPNGTGVVAVRSGKTLRVYDGDNSDYIQMWHDGTDGRLTALGGVINLVSETLLEPLLQDYSIESASFTPTGTTQTLTYSDGPAFEVDLESVTGNITITLASAPPSGVYGQLVVKVTQDSTVARTITWAGGTFRWPGGTAHPMNSTLNGFSIYTFETWDGGTTWWATGADYS